MASPTLFLNGQNCDSRRLSIAARLGGSNPARNFTIAGNCTQGAPRFSPYRLQAGRNFGAKDENQPSPPLPARIAAVDDQVAAGEIAAGIRG
jgi:hypothetical protein